MSDSLRSYEAWASSIRNFESWVGDAVPGGSDVDFMCERYGNFLVVEGKHYYKGVSVPWGQHLALKALAEMPEFTVLLVGEAKDSKLYLADYYSLTRKKVEYRRSSGAWFPGRLFVPTNVEGLQDYLREWWGDCTREDAA